MQKATLTDTDIILRLSYIGYSGKTNLQDLMDWMYKNYQISLDNDIPFWKLYFENKLLIISKIVNLDDYGIFLYISELILRLWKCENGILDGPEINNFEEPDIEWT